MNIRLKALSDELGVQPIKLIAAVEALGETLVEDLLIRMKNTPSSRDVYALPDTKGTLMPTGARQNSQVPNEYQRLEAALKEARIPSQLWDGIGDIWVDSPVRAHALITRFKDSAVRMKAADPLDTAYQQLRTARDRQDAAGVQAALEQITLLVSPSTAKVGAHLRDTQKPRQKEAPSLSSIEQIARATMPELYDQKGT